MSEPLQMLIGSRRSEFVEIVVHDRQFPDATDFWDGNWLTSTISIAAGSWKGEFVTTLRNEDFTKFREALEALYRTLRGEACFATMECSLFVSLNGDGLGHLSVEGEARTELGAGSENRFKFHLPSIDQTYLPPIIKQLKAIESAYPVLGSPK